MKLRNKKTGETGYYLHTHRDHNTGFLKVAVLKDGVPFSEFKPHEPIYDYDSLAGLNKDWEDDTPVEPLIKDEKIREAVRAWAKANNTERVAIQNNYCLSAEGDEIENIVFASPIFRDIDDDVPYTITELCGEDER